MESMGLRELRQNASDYIRRVEEGDSFLVTINGRPAAKLVPVDKPAWVDASVLEGLWQFPVDAESWEEDLRYFDDEIRDPWEPR